MRLKKEDNIKNDKITVRVSNMQLNKLKAKANVYCDGNLSEWILYAALHFIPSKEELVEDKKTPAKKAGAVTKSKRKVVRN